MLHSVFVVALILGVIGPSLHSVTMLSVILPVAAVSSAIQVLVVAIAMGFIVSPLSLVDISVGLNDSSLSMSFVLLPVTSILDAVLPDLGSLTLSLVLIVPLAVVDAAIVHLDGPSVDEWAVSRRLTLVKLELTILGFYFICEGVRVVWHLFQFFGELHPVEDRPSFIQDHSESSGSVGVSSVRRLGHGVQ